MADSAFVALVAFFLAAGIFLILAASLGLFSFWWFLIVLVGAVIVGLLVSGL